MKSEKKIPGTEEAWDDRVLGADEDFVAPLKASDEAGIDAALELQPISIRLQKSLIEDFKLIAQLNGVGYQPLMRQVLARFADCEKKRILREAAAAVTDAQRENCEEIDCEETWSSENGHPVKRHLPVGRSSRTGLDSDSPGTSAADGCYRTS